LRHHPLVKSLILGEGQGDQIGRIFACWAIGYFWWLFENERRRKNNWATGFQRKSYLLIVPKKMGWASFWATFSKTCLVTLERGWGGRFFSRQNGWEELNVVKLGQRT
jgi:hypothetical protein